MVRERDRLSPLAGLDVVVAGDAYVGRLLARFLAEQGAAVHELSASSEPGATERSIEGLLRAADVLIDTTAAGSLARAGFDRARIEALNPRLIACRIDSLPAEAGVADGPPLEWIATAELGFHRPRGEQPPVLEPLALASTYTALQSAMLIVAALAERDGDGAGRAIEQSLFGGGLLALCGRLQFVENAAIRSSLKHHRVPIAERFECADGRYLQSEGTVPAVARSLCAAFGHPEWSDAAVEGLAGVDSAEEEQEWRRRFSELFAARSSWEWEQEIADHGGAASVCRTRGEWASDSHTAAAEILERDDSGAIAIGPAVRLFGGPIAEARRPTRRAGHAPLSGLRVVDLCVILAGPTCGRLLGELGADVIKVDAPFWVQPPWVRTFGWLDVNRNKRSVIFDLATEEARAALWRVIDDADVVVENYRLGKMAALGFGFDQVAERHPGIVYVSLNAYDFGGPLSARPGWDPNAQAVSGMELRWGGPVPVQAAAPINDYATGIAGALGAVLGVRHARSTGQSVHVQGSLARTASILLDSQQSWQSVLSGEQTERPSWLETDVNYAECKDGWIAYAGELPMEVRGLERDAALSELTLKGVTAAAARTPEELRELEWVHRAGLLRRWEHPKWGPMTHVFATPRLTGMEISSGTPAPEPGADTEALLAEVGYGEKEIRSLLANGAVSSTVQLFPL